MKKLISVFITLGIILTIGGGCIIGYCGARGYYPGGSIDNKEYSQIIDKIEKSVGENTAVSYDGTYSKTYSDNDAKRLTELHIETSSANVYIETGSELSVTCEKINTDAFEEEFDGDTLQVKYKTGFDGLFSMGSKSEIHITVPEKDFDKIDIDISAGDMVISNITTEKADIDITAGSLDLDSLTVNDETEIDISAGSLTAMNCTFDLLSVEQSAGSFTSSETTLTGNVDINLSAGDLTMDVNGSENDFSFDISRSAGSASVNGSSKTPDTNGAKNFDIDISAGDCSIYFNN